MAIPTHVFLDTSVFDQQRYNFSSQAFTAFVANAKSFGLTLLLPDMTLSEIKRHIDARCDKFIESMSSALAEVPFLLNVRFVKQINRLDSIKLSIQEDRYVALYRFLDQLNVEHIRSQSADLQEILFWYEKGMPPFGKSRKKSEFPDAVAISMLESFARKQKASIAVVSGDADFKDACVRVPTLHYFQHISQFSEFLISFNFDLRSLAPLLALSRESIDEWIRSDFKYFLFRTASSAHLKRSSEIISLTVDELHIVSLGLKEVVLGFSAQLEAKHSFCVFDVNQWIEETNSIVEHRLTISGSAKIARDSGGAKEGSVLSLEYDRTDFPIATPMIFVPNLSP